MKKSLTICMIAAMLLLLCACGAGTEPKATQSPYADVIARLEAGDYDGARSLIDIMEGKQDSTETEAQETVALETAPPETQLPVQMETIQTEPVAAADRKIVELTKETVREYFEFKEELHFGTQSGCTQYITLKEAYSDQLLAMENVKVEVSYLWSNAYGKIDLEEEEFRAEYYDILSREKEVRTLEPDSNGMAWISEMLSFSKKGYFPNYAMDVTIESGSGKLIFATP